jgi:hypothetical protein
VLLILLLVPFSTGAHSCAVNPVFILIIGITNDGGEEKKKKIKGKATSAGTKNPQVHPVGAGTKNPQVHPVGAVSRFFV